MSNEYAVKNFFSKYVKLFRTDKNKGLPLNYWILKKSTSGELRFDTWCWGNPSPNLLLDGEIYLNVKHSGLCFLEERTDQELSYTELGNTLNSACERMLNKNMWFLIISDDNQILMLPSEDAITVHCKLLFLGFK